MRKQPSDVIAEALRSHVGNDFGDAAFAALDVTKALDAAGYVVVPREDLALVLSRYLQGDTSRDAASDAALHALYVDLDTTAKGSSEPSQGVTE